ncbi:MAG: hypothetical protein ACYTFY_11475 [Planctomycetota bacterium]|jgi:DNA-directed RNA polymerase subunit RPC12/RpoP
MFIHFNCKCGRKWKLREEAVGKLVKCPDCGSGIRISKPETITEEYFVDSSDIKVEEDNDLKGSCFYFGFGLLLGHLVFVLVVIPNIMRLTSQN